MRPFGGKIWRPLFYYNAQSIPAPEVEKVHYVMKRLRRELHRLERRKDNRKKEEAKVRKEDERGKGERIKQILTYLGIY